MKFAHFADLHLGCWRDAKMNGILLDSFDKAIDDCIAHKVDFILMAGDIFDNSMPSFDVLDRSTKKLKELKERNIPVYIIAGSHDYSPSGKTMLRVLENTGLVMDVGTPEEDEDGKLILHSVKDEKTGTVITGLLGRAGSLDGGLYEKLSVGAPEAPFKIFMFHAGIEEFKPAYLESVKALPLDALPKGFDYYAGGHIHIRAKEKKGAADIVFPGPLMPCNFREYELLKHGSYALVSVNDGQVKIEDILMDEIPVKIIRINAENKTPEEIQEKMVNGLGNLQDSCLVFTRIEGVMERGSPSDIDFKAFEERALEQGARLVKKNISALSTKEYDEISLEHESLDNVESSVIEKFVEENALEPTDAEKIELLMDCLDLEKHEGEKNADFEERVYAAGEKFLKA